MRYILSGEPAEIEKVIRENRIRVSRGVIRFTPYEPKIMEVADVEADSKSAVSAETDTKPYEPKIMEVADVEADSKSAVSAETDTKPEPNVTPKKKR